MKNEIDVNKLYTVFGSYRAEWLKNRIYEFYTEPKYYAQLFDTRPTVLIGGRGTGKTTVLKALSYEGQHALGKYQGAEERRFGIYFRINTNRTTAFEGPDLSEGNWVALFGHYFNIIVVKKVFEFLDWYGEELDDSVDISTDEIKQLSLMLLNEELELLEDVSKGLLRSEILLQNYINNIDSVNKPFLSHISTPIDFVFSILKGKEQFAESVFYLLVDEYENLLDYQQRVVNTLIKHSSNDYSFKIGVREFGFREKSTLNANEILSSPADYVRIDINDYGGGDFRDFAVRVCVDRLKSIFGKEFDEGALFQFFPAISNDEEALLLSNGSGKLSESESFFEKNLDAAGYEIASELPVLLRYLMYFWAKKESKELKDIWADFTANTEKWRTRYENYKYSLLFTLTPKGASLVKYYCGIDTFVLMAGGNIRYFMELIEQSIVRHARSNGNVSQPVSGKVQTITAQEVGRKNLSELEGMSIDGAKLSKIVLSIGRIMQVYARNLMGRRPEINQFKFEGVERLPAEKEEKFNRLLRAGITYLAIVRYKGTKATSHIEIKEYDYALHPIFSAMFNISPRRKRNFVLNESDFVSFSENNTALKNLLKTIEGGGESLPTQLSFFAPFYDED